MFRSKKCWFLSVRYFIDTNNINMSIDNFVRVMLVANKNEISEYFITKICEIFVSTSIFSQNLPSMIISWNHTYL